MSSYPFYSDSDGDEGGMAACHRKALEETIALSSHWNLPVRHLSCEPDDCLSASVRLLFPFFRYFYDE